MDPQTADPARRSAGTGTLALISPHLDDGVFSCGEALAAHPGSTVVTVFAGLPADGAQRTEWDLQCGFDSAAEAVRARRAEDEAALRILGAAPRWLDFGDSQYGDTPDVDEVARALREAVDAIAPALVLYPLGLFHSDHRLVHDACRRAFGARGARTTLVYEDALYRAMPGLLQARLAVLAEEGLEATPAPALAGPGHAARKGDAVQRYASQLRAFGPHGHDDLREAERCWRLAPRTTTASLHDERATP